MTSVLDTDLINTSFFSLHTTISPSLLTILLLPLNISASFACPRRSNFSDFLLTCTTR